jgi:murein L,D-transpeptidase YcbB/YkuD
LKAAVVAFQKEHGLPGDGIVGNATRAALNDVEVLTTDKILANIEEWRGRPTISTTSTSGSTSPSSRCAS